MQNYCTITNIVFQYVESQIRIACFHFIEAESNMQYILLY